MSSPAFPVPHQPVVVRPVVRPGVRRWAIALTVAAVALVGTALAFSFAASPGSGTRLAGWAPERSVAYAEMALRPPSGQADAVATFLGHLPGFADRSRLDEKLDALGERFVDAATAGKLAYADLQPWLGETAAGVLVRVPTDERSLPSFVSVVAVTDETALRAWLAEHVPPGSSSTPYGGTELTIGETTGGTWAVAVLDGVLLAGERGAVEAAVDTGGRSGFASSDPARTALGAVGDPALGVAFVDVAAFARAVEDRMPALSGALGTFSLGELLPAWSVTALRVREDVLEAETISPVPALLDAWSEPGSGAAAGAPTLPPRVDRSSALAARLPSDTLLALEGRDLGPTIAALSARASTLVGDGSAGSSLDLLLGLAGNADALAGWMGDGAAVVLPGDSRPSVGIVALVSDEAAASATLRQLRALFGFVARDAVTFEETTVADATVTTLVVADPDGLVRRLVAASGSSLPGLTDGTWSAIGDHAAGTPLRLSWTVANGLLVAGSSLDFVRVVLGTDADGSLATLDRYRTAIERAGSSNTGQVWMDVPGLVALVVPELPVDARALYDRELAPYVASLGGAAGASLAGEPMRVRFVVTVR